MYQLKISSLAVDVNNLMIDSVDSDNDNEDDDDDDDDTIINPLQQSALDDIQKDLNWANSTNSSEMDCGSVRKSSLSTVGKCLFLALPC